MIFVPLFRKSDIWRQQSEMASKDLCVFFWGGGGGAGGGGGGGGGVWSSESFFKKATPLI